MEQIVIVEPAFFSQFHCVGSACPAHCCKGWDIELDEPTVSRYLQSDKIEIRNIAVETVRFSMKTAYAKYISRLGKKR